MKNYIKINAKRQAYGVEDIIDRTMTVGDLVHFLMENYDEDTPIILSHDNGYTYGGIREEDIEETPVSGDGYEHTITVSEQVDIKGENGEYRGTDELSCPVNETTDHRPDRKSFYCWLCALYPQYEWRADDGDDWDEDEDTDYCQYTAQIDPSDPSHIYLAAYNRTKA